MSIDPSLLPMSTIYLDCPFSEKAQAKSSGARWDKSAKKWFVPADLYPVIDRFNQWRPNAKVYLTCPFEQKDEAKKSGAKWDANVKRWYISLKGKAAVPARFSKWLTNPTISSTTTDPEPKTPQKKISLSKNAIGRDKTKRGNSQDAARLRVNENMTNDQLKDECRFRDIKGLSGKNKEWLLQQLKIGSIWHTVVNSSAAVLKTVEKSPVKPTSAKKVADKDTKTAATRLVKNVTDKDRKMAAKVIKKVADKGKKGLARKYVASQPPDWISLPRVVSSLTAIQLTHELLHRCPNMKGISNKSKSWFLGELGEGSIWTTSPNLLRDLSNFPRVSVSMTVAQLVHEIMARSPSTKGLSNKAKNDLLKLAGVGSIWTTAGVCKEKTSNSGRKKSPVPIIEPIVKKARKEDVSKSSAESKKETPMKKSAGTKKYAVSATKTSSKKQPPKKQPNQKSATTKKRTSTTVNDRGAAKRSSIIPSQAPSSQDVTVSNAEKQTGNELMKAPVAKRAKIESVPVVSSHMTVAQLKAELKTRDPNAKGLSRKGKEWLICQLGSGTEVCGSAQYKAKADLKAAKLHIYQTLCHSHPLSASVNLRAPEIWGLSTSKKRSHVGSCDVKHSYICQQTPYRTCERCSYDICKACYEIDSLPQREKEQKIRGQLHAMAERNAAMQRESEEQERASKERRRQQEMIYEREQEEQMLEMHADDLERFSGSIRNPTANFKDVTKRLKYTVWTCDVHRRHDVGDVEKDFNSSYDTLEEANLRAEYVFYYDNPSGCDKDEIYADMDDELPGGLRYLRSNPDGGGSWTASVLPSEVFDLLQPRRQSYASYGDFYGGQRGQQKESRGESRFSRFVRNPSAKHMNQQHKLQYTVWKSCGYDRDGWHSYGGRPEKAFDSCYRTLEEANDRVEYLFYYDNPWGLRDEELPFAETDEVNKDGFRFLECSPDDSERWTVSVIPSVAFDYINL